MMSAVMTLQRRPDDIVYPASYLRPTTIRTLHSRTNLGYTHHTHTHKTLHNSYILNNAQSNQASKNPA